MRMHIMMFFVGFHMGVGVQADVEGLEMVKDVDIQKENLSMELYMEEGMEADHFGRGCEDENF
jgi:hypothetical protein